MAGTNSGWIKLHRKLLDSPVWQSPNLARFWIWCLLRASHNEFTIRVGYSEITLEPGQFVYSHSSASIETTLSEKVVRTCLDALGSGNDPLLGRKRAGRNTIVTILKWRDYQVEGDGEGRKTGSEKAANGQALLIGSKKIKKERSKSEAIDVIWNGERLLVPDVLMEKYRTKFPRLDVPSIVIDAERWLLKKPAKAAGYKSFDAFLNNWLRGEEEKRQKSNGADAYEVSEADAALQLQFERELAAGRVAND